jgi:cell division protein FtsZ
MTDSSSTPAPVSNELKSRLTMKVIGIGGAGGNAVQALAREGLADVRFLALNTDARALDECAVDGKVILGAKLTRGLGAGGDPELGRTAAEEEAEKLRELCAETDLVFVIAGLGGGTGTGAGPVLARIAREQGALVIALVTLPFEFEGTRRRRQAEVGYQEFRSAADAVICLPNQRLLELIDDHTSVIEAFGIGNELLGQGVRGIWRLMGRSGLINVDFADLCSVFRGRHAEGVAVTAEASGENRVREIVTRITEHPLLEQGRSLAEADAALITLAGGPDLTMAEVNRMMEQVHRQCENAHLIIGASIDEELKDRLLVTFIACRQPAGSQAAVPPDAGEFKAVQSRIPRAGSEGLESQLLKPDEESRPASRFVAPAPNLSPGETEALLKRQGESGGRRRRRVGGMAQGQLPLEIVSRGRFEKSEPTIHHGEDLDVPTYIRRGVALN